MSVYHKEKSKYLDCALKSIWDDQILKPEPYQNAFEKIENAIFIRSSS